MSSEVRQSYYYVIAIGVVMAIAIAAFGQSSDSITTGDVDAVTAAKNRQYVESRSGVINLPTGKVVFDKAAAIKPGTVLVGNGTTISQQYTASPFRENCTVQAVGTGQSHVDTFTHAGPSKINTAAPVPVGALLYCWQNISRPNGTIVAPSPVRQQRIVLAKSGNLVTLNAAVDSRCDVLKWYTDASPIQDVQEGSATVTVSRGQWPVGSSVLVTSGPQIANESTGESRLVAAVSGNVVTLDRPLRRGYTMAALARVQPVGNVTIRDCTIDVPVNAASECVFMTLCTNWRFERCKIRKTAMGNCAGVRFVDCELGWVQVTASSHGVQFDNCRLESANFEEGTHDCEITSCRLGPVGPNMNCVTMNAQSERLAIRNSHLLGGTAFTCSQILFFGPGRENVLENLTMTGRAPCWLKGGFRIVNVHSDGEINIQ